jgi:hypothetical protein
MERGTIVKYRLGFRAARQSRPVRYGAFNGGVITLIRLKYRAPERPRARWPRTGLKRRQRA